MKYLTEKYPECLVKYEPTMVNGVATGITCTEPGDIEQRVDIQMAKKAGCKGITEICAFLNGEL